LVHALIQVRRQVFAPNGVIHRVLADNAGLKGGRPMDMFPELTIWRQAATGVATQLPHDAASLRNPLDYDAAAQALVEMARAGLMEIVSQQVEQVGERRCITDLSFRRLR
jgi:hypothetical protein